MKVRHLPLVLLLAVLAGALFTTRSAHREPDPATSRDRDDSYGGKPAAAGEFSRSPNTHGTARAGNSSAHSRWQPDAVPEEAASDRPAIPAVIAEGEIERHRMAAMEEVLPWIASAPGLDREQSDRLVRYAGQLALSDTPYVRCWSPDAPPELVAAHLMVEQRIAAAGLSLKALQVRDRWGRTATQGGGQNTQGLPVTITWSIVQDGTPISPTELEESPDPSSLRSRLAQIYGGSASGPAASQPWFPIFQQVFDNLAANSGLRFVYEPSDDGVGISGSSSGANWGLPGVRGDIRIGGHPLDGNSGTLAYAYYPDNGDVVFDTSDSFFSNTSDGSVRLRNVLEHEIGHSLGLGHVCPINRTKLMEPFVTSEFRGSQFDDIHSHQRNYGDPLEVHGGVRSNDTSATATTLSPPPAPGSLATWQWLSIDDDSDSDHFALTTSRLQAITVRVVPATGSYLEGSQLSDGTCSGGTTFNPALEQNLVLDLLGPAGTVVATAPSRAAGQTEAITDFRVLTDGTHVIRVRGGTTDRAQLYRLEVVVEDVAPPSDLTVSAIRLDAESNSGANGAPDPGETVRLGITLTNGGNLTATGIAASLTALPGMTLFEGSVAYDTLAPGESAERFFTLALPDLPPGTAVQIPLELDSSAGSVLLPVPLTLGKETSDTALLENFDASANLPDGWISNSFGAGRKWVTATDRFRSGPNAAFSASVTANGEGLLLAPVITVPAAGGTLEFYHSRNLQTSFDGGVLEASRNSGAWFDVMETFAVLSGDYNGTISGTSGSTIAGRRAWTGTNRSFTPVRVEIPVEWGGESLQFRWRLVHDSSTANSGWSVDDVAVGSTRFDADSFRPVLALSTDRDTLSESPPSTTATLTLATPLPLAKDVTVTLESGGSADPDDFAGSPGLSLTLPAGATSTRLILTTVPDGIQEREETLVLTLPASDPDFAADPAAASVILIVGDALVPVAIELADLISTYDGFEKTATVTTDPAGLDVAVTYDGEAAPPAAAGTYTVVATVTTPGYEGTATGTLVILSPYAAWISLHADPADPDAVPIADLDGDGWSNADEYGLGTLPADPASLPVLTPMLDATELRLSLPPAPPGVLRTAETSTDLLRWTKEDVRAEGDGFAVTRDGDRRFLRLHHEVEP